MDLDPIAQELLASLDEPRPEPAVPKRRLSHRQAEAKARVCITLAEHQMPPGTSLEDIEDRAQEMMDWPDARLQAHVAAMESRLEALRKTAPPPTPPTLWQRLVRFFTAKKT